jgi:dihydroflavonol-4-reductase
MKIFSPSSAAFPAHNMTTVLVTGGTGFIGANLVHQLLARGYRVRILRRPHSDMRALGNVTVEEYMGDVTDAKSVQPAMAGCDIVFHTAALVTFERKKQELQMAVNVAGTRIVVECALAAGVRRMVHTSSIAAVGYPPPGTLATEETVFNWEGKSGYKLSKHLAEVEVLAGVKRGLDAVIVNPSVVIGERDIHMHGGQLVKEAVRGLIPFYLDGGMNVVYVGDVVNGHILAAERGRMGERYILGGQNMTHKEIFKQAAIVVGGRQPFIKLPIPFVKAGAWAVEKVSTLAGIEPIISADMVAGAGRYLFFSSEKAERELGYTHSSFETAVRSAFEWYKANGFV